MAPTVLDNRTHAAILILTLAAGGLVALTAQYRWPLAFVVPAAGVVIAAVAHFFLRLPIGKTAIVVAVAVTALGVILSRIS